MILYKPILPKWKSDCLLWLTRHQIISVQINESTVLYILQQDFYPCMGTIDRNLTAPLLTLESKHQAQ